MRKHHLLCLGVVLLLILAASARADELYSFSFTNTGGPIESFSFSFTVPTFVTAGESPSFTPFTITDGTNSVTLTEDLAVAGIGFGDFEFGTSTGSTLESGGITWSPPDGGAIIFDLASLPTADGTYSFEATGGGFYYASGEDLLDGTATLTISAVPEPTSVILMSPMLLGLALVARRRIARRLSPACPSETH